MLTSHDNLIVTNEGTDTLKWRWDGRDMFVPVGASVHVPFDLVRKELGDPRSGQEEREFLDGVERIRINARAVEIGRLEALYGTGVISQTEGRIVPLHEAAPKVTVTTITGEPVETVVSDPEGLKASPIPISADTPEALSARVADMQKALDVLLGQQKAQEQAPMDTNEEVPEDGPASGGTAGV